MIPVSISGIGMISACGRGLSKFESALREGWMPPTTSKDGRKAYRIAMEDVTDREVLQHAKRADRFSKLTVLAAHDAICDSGLPLEEVRNSTGLIVATAFGAHSSIFKFLDGIIDYGECKVSPTTFAHSIHNAAAAYVASVLKMRGPVMTITQFNFAMHQALLLAYAWLNEKRVERVLVGIADECSPAMEYICEEKLSAAGGGKMNPLSLSEKPELVPGEGCAFFLLSLNPLEAKYGAFSDIQIGEGCRGWDDTDLSIVSGNAMAGSEAGYRNILREGAKVAAYSPLYGGLMSSGAFESCAAALMLKNQVRYDSPIFAKMGSGEIEAKMVEPQKMRAIECITHSYEGEFSFLKLIKSQTEKGGG